ncbi:VOC family protein [Ktedonosporobacter rubrisoli]|uniref:VOC family protein n=1 Tax=Ktedonosporobacter rubrisoli TaxID=2509675 RepID=A0A4P6JKG0_KTERU|nr:VOC family protein [Ktedonosporobacter rubrisoli]QBD75126.1 VOC family protein [Ktedonosporobacter rubrisoli]
MARLLGPDFISLQVRDLSASRTFYTETLGLTIDERFTSADFVLFDTNSIPLGISQAKVNLAEAPQPGWGFTLWLDCDHVDELHARLEAAGVTIVTPPFNSPFGRALVFADPDGYRITANENPWERFPLGGRKKL